jgi:glycosyltransferase involved in cell wall biosynthesis
MNSNPTLRIVIASGVRGDTRRYRTFHLFEQCLLLKLDVKLTHVMAPEFQAVSGLADLLVLHRAAWDPNIGRAMETVHARGGKVIYDTDDLLFDPTAFRWIDSPDFKDPVRAGLYIEEMKRHRRTMESCDAIMTSTLYLAEQASGLGLATYVHKNAFSTEMLALARRAIENPRPDDGKFTIGYASGTPTHNLDFETLGPALRQVLDDSKQVSLWLVGPIKLDAAWMKYTSRIVHLPHVPWRILPAYLSRFDINLAPLVIDNPFAQSKSEIKWMEAALVKVPTIASGTDTFNDAIQPGVTGMIASSIAEWQESLTQLIADRKVRCGMGASAYDEVLRSYSPSTRAGEFLKILQKVTARELKPATIQRKKSGHTPSGPAPMNTIQKMDQMERVPSLARMAYYSLQHRGVGTLAKQTWIFFRRSISRWLPYTKHDSRH